MSSAPCDPAEFGEGPVGDAALEAAGYAAGLDVWDPVTKAYEIFLGDGALANSQLWSLREAIRAELLAEQRPG
jgi:TPP-dependent pyruvate/acetoin dehydrogenase alpha subunit